MKTIRYFFTTVAVIIMFACTVALFGIVSGYTEQVEACATKYQVPCTVAFVPDLEGATPAQILQIILKN